MFPRMIKNYKKRNLKSYTSYLKWYDRQLFNELITNKLCFSVNPKKKYNSFTIMGIGNTVNYELDKCKS